MEFWERRLRQGNKKFFRTPEELMEAAADYFTWATQHPLTETVIGWYQGEATEHTVNHPRAFTWQGMSVHMGISSATLDSYRQNPDFAEAIDAITSVIFAQKFEGAAVGLFNSNLIARDLGISEKSEITGAGGAPLDIVVQYQLPDNGRDREPARPEVSPDVVEDEDEE